MTYIVHAGEPASITCGECGRRSYSPTDVASRYCGFCDFFHNDPRPRRLATDFADNAVYVKSGYAKDMTDKQRIEQLARHDATVKVCMDVYHSGAMSYEQMLEGLVVLLVQQKDAAVAVALDLNNRTLPPMELTGADARQALLALQPVGHFLNQVAPGAGERKPNVMPTTDGSMPWI